MPPFTLSSLVTSWVVEPAGLAGTALLTASYVGGLYAARRARLRWPVLRTAAFLTLGVGTWVLATCGGLAAYRGSLFWVAAAQATVISAVTPIGLALGKPVLLAQETLGDHAAARLRTLLHSRLTRALMFPLASSVLAAGTLVAVFFTPYLATSIASLAVREVLYLHLLVTGLLVVLPLLGEEMLPDWCTHPMRALLAFVDGLADAVPGILVMTAPRLLAPAVAGFTRRSWGPSPLWDQRLGGGAMLGVAEVVGLPLLGAVIVAWVRADEAEARIIDAALDHQRAGAARVAGADGSVDAALRDRPWWETDPRFTDRG